MFTKIKLLINKTFEASSNGDFVVLEQTIKKAVDVLLFEISLIFLQILLFYEQILFENRTKSLTF